MTDLRPRADRGLDRRTLMRAGVLAAAGVTAFVASPLLTGTARADSLQNGWYYCYTCWGLYHGGNTKVAGVCPVSLVALDTIPHGYIPAPTFNYIMTYAAGPGPNPQPNWYWCRNCFGIFHTTNANKMDGYCPAPVQLTHDGSHSFAYSMYYDSPNNGQPGWFWCRNCSVLFYGGSNNMAGECPYFGKQNYPHDGSKSFDSYNAAH